MSIFNKVNTKKNNKIIKTIVIYYCITHGRVTETNIAEI